MNIKSNVKKLQDSDRYELNLKTYKEKVKANRNARGTSLLNTEAR
jgi:hypothetical protein